MNRNGIDTNNNNDIYTTQIPMSTSPTSQINLNKGLNLLIMDTLVLGGVSYALDPDNFTEKLKMAAGASALIQVSSMTGIRNIKIIPDWSS